MMLLGDSSSSGTYCGPQILHRCYDRLDHFAKLALAEETVEDQKLFTKGTSASRTVSMTG